MALSQGKPDPSKLSYLAVAAYNNDIFTYSTRLNEQYVEVGSLVAVAGANSSTCQKGRVLRENGRKLWPGANPGINTYLVGVFDAISGITGFIDPNSPVFTLFSTDKVYSLERSVDPGPGALLDNGMPILTNSSVEAGTSVTAGTDVNIPNGRLIMNSGNSGVAQMSAAGATIVGLFKKLNVLAVNCKPTSRVFLTYTGLNSPGVLSAEGTINGRFTIVSSSTTDLGVVQWLVIN